MDKSRLWTQADLRDLGFSKDLISQVCNKLDSVRLENRQKGYNQIILKEAIAKKLSQPKIKTKTRESLEVALRIMNDKSNVVEVDFLRNLSSEERIDFLKDHRERLRVEGEAILQNVDELLKRAKKFT